MDRLAFSYRQYRRLWLDKKFGSIDSCQILSRYFTSSKDRQDDDAQTKQVYHVWEQTVSSSSSSMNKTTHKGRVLYKSTPHGWERIATPSSSSTSSFATSLSSLDNLYKDGDLTVQSLPIVHHFLPARYPYSVCSSYGRYASFVFMGSVAGSSAGVLSTTALLKAVGVGTHSAAPMAGALNWVIKDGIGQLGGVIFASQLGKGGMDFEYWKGKFGLSYSSHNKAKKKGNFQSFGTADNNPKKWRMVAVWALDLSTLLEVCTPMITHMMGKEWFLPCASIANVGKNIGSQAASASRAAIHQSLSTGGTIPILPAIDKSPHEENTSSKSSIMTVVSNLGDVTAKSASQKTAASLLGTANGVFLSHTVCADCGTSGILATFFILSVIHQGKLIILLVWNYQ